MIQGLVNLLSSWLLVAVIVVGMLALSCLRPKTRQPAYEKILTLNIWVLIIHALHILIYQSFIIEQVEFGWAAPYGLLYPALLFLCFKSASRNKDVKKYNVLFHSLPFFLFSLAYVFFIAASIGEKGMGFLLYKTWLFRLIVISFIVYSLGIWFSPLKIARFSIARLLNVLVSVLMLVGLLFFAVSHAGRGIKFELSNLLELMICGMMLIFMLLLFWHKLAVVKYIDPYAEVTLDAVYTDNTSVPKERELFTVYKKSTLTADRLVVYEAKIRAAIIEEQLFLDPKCNLEKLSVLTGIPKHHLSQVFSLRFKKGFASIIGELRINYAIELIDKSEDKINMESLAYECGFNSKVSFNRHFKQLIGTNPSDYRRAQRK